MASVRRNLICTGSGPCGKSSLIYVFRYDRYPEVYVPQYLDQYVADIDVDKKSVELSLKEIYSSMLQIFYV